MQWEPIETAPRDGCRVLCGFPDGTWDGLVWKTNTRIVYAHERGEYLDLAASYFGVPSEMDDWDYAKPKNFPHAWLPLVCAPTKEELAQRPRQRPRLMRLGNWFRAY
jgi:hypothetical protein